MDCTPGFTSSVFEVYSFGSKIYIDHFPRAFYMLPGPSLLGFSNVFDWCLIWKYFMNLLLFSYFSIEALSNGIGLYCIYNGGDFFGGIFCWIRTRKSILVLSVNSWGDVFFC
jgi:hypothetical protein